MGPLSYMLSIVEWNVIMRRISVVKHAKVKWSLSSPWRHMEGEEV